MAELKTKANDKDVYEFLSELDDELKLEDSKKLINIFTDVTGFKALMWWDSIVWFWSYHYKSERSTQEWDWPLTWFSPRKQNISIYIMPWFSKYTNLLEKLWKHKISKWSCLYIKKLADIDIEVLKELIKISLIDMKKIYW